MLVTFYPAYCKANTPKEAARIKAGGGEGRGREWRRGTGENINIGYIQVSE